MALFSISATERIDAAHLFQHAAEYEAKFSNKVFGGNDFRIVTIANAVAAGAPPYLIRTVEFHNHYCPGITSGILTALYIKAHFPSPKSGYFVHALEHWCKEDALMLLLNASPATGSYAVSYPSEAEKAARTKEAKDAGTIVYRQDDKTKKWQGLVLSFEWAETSCGKKGNGVIDKLCADLWYLERIGKPENFVKIIKTFELPDGVAPKDWVRPGTDPLKMLGLAK
jgi:formylmethanofuran dehydrogenase subunit E-like metal-binding protein